MAEETDDKKVKTDEEIKKEALDKLRKIKKLGIADSDDKKAMIEKLLTYIFSKIPKEKRKDELYNDNKINLTKILFKQKKIFELPWYKKSIIDDKDCEEFNKMVVELLEPEEIEEINRSTLDDKIDEGRRDFLKKQLPATAAGIAGVAMGLKTEDAEAGVGKREILNTNHFYFFMVIEKYKQIYGEDALEGKKIRFEGGTIRGPPNFIIFNEGEIINEWGSYPGMLGIEYGLIDKNRFKKLLGKNFYIYENNPLSYIFMKHNTNIRGPPKICDISDLNSIILKGGTTQYLAYDKCRKINNEYFVKGLNTLPKEEINYNNESEIIFEGLRRDFLFSEYSYKNKKLKGIKGREFNLRHRISIRKI